MSLETESGRLAEDPMRGAWIVEAVIVALMLLLVGKAFGIAITLVAFLIALAPASAIVLGVEYVRNNYKLRK